MIRAPWRRGFLLIPLLLACVAIPQQAQGACREGCDLNNGNTFLGDDALINTSGTSNTAIGSHALANSQFGDQNTATGFNTLLQNYGGLNTANGANALQNNINGFQNTAIGGYALYSNVGSFGGQSNTATGAYALYSNTGSGKGSDGVDGARVRHGGTNNTANGVSALFSNTEGGNNTAIGVSALGDNTTGDYNTANGIYALTHNTTANFNTANGAFALNNNTTGFQNAATGVSALSRNTIGNRNVAEGYAALLMNRTGNFNTAVGFQALFQNRAGSNNVALGFNAGSNLTNGSGNVCIGYSVVGAAGESNTTRIGNIFASAASGRAVYVNSDNKIGTLVSSRRFKEEIKPMDKASDAILALKPVTFRYKKEIEANGGIMFGLIAEDVEKADPDLVTRNDKGEVETVRYDAVNAMLLNEFLKEHRTVQELKSNAAKQEATIAQQQKQIEALTASLQKVSAQVEMIKQGPQVVDNRQ